MRLTVTGDHTYATANAWETVLRTFAHLEELKICGSTYTHVTPVFQGLLMASTLHEGLPVACPNLKWIGVEGSGRVETYTVMRDCFRYRGDKGVVLQVLDLTFMPDAEGLTLQLRDALIKDMSKDNPNVVSTYTFIAGTALLLVGFLVSLMLSNKAFSKNGVVAE